MTRGTVLIIGRKNRETELLTTRLEREGFMIVTKTSEPAVAKWLRDDTAQAVLFTPAVPESNVRRVLARVRSHKRMQHVPAILLAESETPEWKSRVYSIGEVLRLHTISLAEAVRRLRLAIQLTQLAREIQS